MFRFFCKSHALVSQFGIDDAYFDGNSVCVLSLSPKKDVSINDLQKFYNVFVNKIIATPPDSKTLSIIADRKKIERKILFSNLLNIYRNIKNAHMRGMDLNSIYTISDDIRHANPDAIKSFAEKFFSKDLASTITTRFRLDK